MFIGYSVLDCFRRPIISHPRITDLLYGFSHRCGNLNVMTFEQVIEAGFEIVEIHTKPVTDKNKVPSMCPNCGGVGNPGAKCLCGRTYPNII